jgi:transcriptional regulator with XRE-family HTH domain
MSDSGVTSGFVTFTQRLGKSSEENYARWTEFARRLDMGMPATEEEVHALADELEVSDRERERVLRMLRDATPSLPREEDARVPDRQALRDLASELNALRHSQGLSISDLAGRAHVSKSMVSEILRGRRVPSRLTVATLADALRVSPEKKQRLITLREMAAPGRSPAGRPPAPVAGEASAPLWQLVTELRKLRTERRLTLSQISQRAKYGTTTIADSMSGKSVPTKQVLVALADALEVSDSDKRRLLELREAARDATEGRQPADQRPPENLPVPVRRSEEVELLHRLTRSLEQQDQLRTAAAESTKLVVFLMTMIGTLQSRLADLTRERDQLRDLQQELAQVLERERHAEHQLRRAQEQRDQAEELVARAQAHVDELTAHLAELRSGTASETGEKR